MSYTLKLVEAEPSKGAKPEFLLGLYNECVRRFGKGVARPEKTVVFAIERPTSQFRQALGDIDVPHAFVDDHAVLLISWGSQIEVWRESRMPLFVGVSHEGEVHSGYFPHPELSPAQNDSLKAQFRKKIP